MVVLLTHDSNTYFTYPRQRVALSGGCQIRCLPECRRVAIKILLWYCSSRAICIAQDTLKCQDNLSFALQMTLRAPHLELR